MPSLSIPIESQALLIIAVHNSKGRSRIIKRRFAFKAFSLVSPAKPIPLRKYCHLPILVPIKFQAPLKMTPTYTISGHLCKILHAAWREINNEPSQLSKCPPQFDVQHRRANQENKGYDRGQQSTPPSKNTLKESSVE
jgi:hypothetical protein